jgi:tetratricopeptide (TPR) repeat protein
MAAGSLPMAAGSLPMAAGSLPMAAGSLPMAQGSLPMAAGSLPMAQGSLPMAQGELPAPQGALPSSIASLFDSPQGGSQGGGGGLVNFGEFEPGEASLSTSAGNNAAAHAAAAAAVGGGGGYGEVDLGGGSDGPAVPMAPPAAISGMVTDDSPGEAKLDEGKAPVIRPRVSRRRGGGASTLLKIGFGAAALIILGGFGMTFTPAGAFGTTYIGDFTKAGTYKRDAADAGVATRRKLVNDGYQSAVGAADDLSKQHDASPRNRPLAAYAAFVELANEARFGVDPARGAKAKGFLFDIPPQTDIPYLLAAQAAQELNSGDLGRARTHLTQAAVHDGADPIVQEISQLQGELELQANDGNAALAAFTKAHAKGASPRSLFGIARANFMLGKQDEARKGIDQTLAQVPTHAGARILLATMKARTDHDMDGSLKDLGMVLDGAAKVNASPKERASALAQKGWVMLAKEHPGDARAAFDEAVKIDPKNVAALLGQGELFYADGRNMEAATRFDEAVNKDPTNADALIGSAKTKIALERYNDAKAQLTAALKTFPKDMRVPLWLGVAEEKLGNRQSAEQLYDKAISLADPKHPDAVTAYARLAQMLAAQGRTNEAQAKLEQAKGKLPDSSALQRALAEVSVAQGKFDDAVAHYLAAIDKDPTDVSAHFKLGVAYRKMRKLDLATAEFDKVAVADKDFPGLTLERGQLFEDAGEADKALAQFKAAFDKAPQELDLKLRMGAAYVALNDIENGMKFLKEVLDARPNSAEAKHYLGRAYMKRGGRDIETALNYFQQATSLDANKEVYWMYVAWAANSTSPVQSGLAQTAVDKALALNKQYGDAFWQKGVIEYHAQAHKDALKDLKRALELNPGRVDVHAVMAEVYEALNDPNNAFAEWQKAIAADKSQFDWDFDYGSLLYERNKIGEAASILGAACQVGDAMQVRPGRLHMAHNLYAEVLEKTGKKAEAIDNYKIYLQTSPQGDPDRKAAQAALKRLGASLDN